MKTFYLAALLTITSGLLFTFSHSIIKQVNYIGPDIHPFEIAFFSNVFSALFYLPIIIRSNFGILRTDKLSKHVSRAFFNSGALTCFYAALVLTELADVIALSLTGPIFVTLGALIFLGEVVTAKRWLAIIGGGIGALIIIRPGFEEMNLGFLFVLLSAGFAAGSKLFAKKLTETDSAVTCSAYVAILQCPITFVAALFFWLPPTLTQLFCLMCIGILVAGAHIFWVQAYKYAEVSALEPFWFLRLIWAAIIGWLFFSEIPDIWIFVGGAMVVLASTYIARSEVKQNNFGANQLLH